MSARPPRIPIFVESGVILVFRGCSAFGAQWESESDLGGLLRSLLRSLLGFPSVSFFEYFGRLLFPPLPIPFSMLYRRVFI
jgi:hypothetical protein